MSKHWIPRTSPAISNRIIHIRIYDLCPHLLNLSSQDRFFVHETPPVKLMYTRMRSAEQHNLQLQHWARKLSGIMVQVGRWQPTSSSMGQTSLQVHSAHRELPLCYHHTMVPLRIWHHIPGEGSFLPNHLCSCQQLPSNSKQSSFTRWDD